jgi:hypothetical protein
VARHLRDGELDALAEPGFELRAGECGPHAQDGHAVLAVVRKVGAPQPGVELRPCHFAAQPIECRAPDVSTAHRGLPVRTA